MSSDSQEGDVCWVCLGPAEPTDPLTRACSCPRPVHAACLARWQLQSVGRSEETACRFCHSQLPDWRAPYNFPTATPVMTVNHNNVQHLLEVKRGEAGKLEFQQNIRKIFGLGLQDVISLTFGCKAPGTDQDMTLTGWQSYDAAVSAGARHAHTKAQGANAACTPHKQTCSHAATHAAADHTHPAGSTACDWSTTAPEQHSPLAVSTATSVQHQCEAISRDVLLLPSTSKHRQTTAASSLLPALMQTLQARVKRPRRA